MLKKNLKLVDPNVILHLMFKMQANSTECYLIGSADTKPPIGSLCVSTVGRMSAAWESDKFFTPTNVNDNVTTPAASMKSVILDFMVLND